VVVLFQEIHLMSTFSPLPHAATAGDAFVQMLPGLRRRLRPAFAGFQPEQREDAIQEALANCFTALARLWERNRRHLAAPAALARYAIAQWFDGRRIGSSMNGQDVSSPYGQRRHGLSVASLGDFDAVTQQTVMADRRSPVPEQAAFRIDFPEWLRQLPPRKRQVALALARGESSRNVALLSGLSCARVCGLRQELCQSWREFHGECVPSVDVA